MALSLDAISLIQAISISQNQTVAAFVATALATSSSTQQIGASPLTLSRLTNAQTTQSSITTELADLATLDTKLQALISAASGLRPAPTSLGSNISVTHTDATTEAVTFDTTQSASLQTGDKVIFSSSFNGVSANTPYWIRRGTTTGNSTDFTLFTDRSDAINNITTTLVNITSTSAVTATVNQVIPQTQAGIDAFFSAFNDLQTFLSTKIASGGSLAGETQLKSLKSALSQSVVSLLSSSDLRPALSTSSSTGVITVNDTALASQISAKAQNIAMLFQDTITDGSNVSKSVIDLAQRFSAPTGVVGEIEKALRTQSNSLAAQITALMTEATHEQTATIENLATIAKSTAAISLQISFINKLAR